MDANAGCHMASTFYEIFRESGLQRQLEHGWGHAYSLGDVTDSASSPTLEFDRSTQSRRSRSRQSRKTPSPTSSRKHSQNRDRTSLETPKSKKPRSRKIKEEDEEEGDLETIQAMQEPSKPYSVKFGSQNAESGDASGYKLNGEDGRGSEYLNTELDTLRKHLLQRANPPRSFP